MQRKAIPSTPIPRTIVSFLYKVFAITAKQSARKLEHDLHEPHLPLNSSCQTKPESAPPLGLKSQKSLLCLYPYIVRAYKQVAKQFIVGYVYNGRLARECLNPFLVLMFLNCNSNRLYEQTGIISPRKSGLFVLFHRSTKKA